MIAVQCRTSGNTIRTEFGCGREVLSMKKIAWDYVILFVQMVFVGIFILYIYSSYIDAYNENFLDRSMYTENVAGIQLSNQSLVSDGEIVILDLNDITVDGDFAIYRYVSYAVGEIIRGIYETTDIFGFSDYIETGRFFDSDDFAAGAKTAVIGQDILALTYEEGGKQYYDVGSDAYEVIGVFQETGSDLDSVIYLNLSALLMEDNDMGLYYVDSKDADTVEYVLTSIETSAAGNYTTSRVEYESPLIKTGMHKTTGLFVYSAIFSSILYLVITLSYFITGREYTVAIQKLCGMTRRNLFVSYGIKMLVTVAASFATICLLERTVADKFTFFATEYLGWQHFALLAVTLLAIGAISTVGIVRLVQRVDISDTLKGR